MHETNDLYETLMSWPDRRLAATYRIAKTRLRPFFANPRNMVVLRRVCKERGLLKRGVLIAGCGRSATELVK